jgi:lipopolysaccharide export system protein LptC
MGAQAAAEAELEKEKALTELRIYETEVTTKIKTDETIRLETVKSDLKMQQIALEADVTVATTPPTTTPAI